jgi:hypothetical protein
MSTFDEITRIDGEIAYDYKYVVMPLVFELAFGAEYSI